MTTLKRVGAAIAGPAVNVVIALALIIMTGGLPDHFEISLETVGTNLLPPEVVKDRLVRSKKPWAVATVATLLVAITLYGLAPMRALAENWPLLCWWML
jgi:hypothetical protein